MSPATPANPARLALKRIGPAGSLFDQARDRGVSFARGDVVELSESCALDVLRDAPADWTLAEPTPAAPEKE